MIFLYIFPGFVLLLTRFMGTISQTKLSKLCFTSHPTISPTHFCTSSPSFDAKKYIKVLTDICRDWASDVDNWGVGEALFYGKAVTSMQTMLDRYARLSPPSHDIHTSLPSPVTQDKPP